MVVYELYILARVVYKEHPDFAVTGFMDSSHKAYMVVSIIQPLIPLHLVKTSSFGF